MAKRHLLIFLIAALVFTLFSLAFSAQVLADLQSLYRGSAEAFSTQLVLKPQAMTDSATAADPTHLVQIQQIVDQRLDKLQLAGTHSVSLQGDQLLVRLPNSENMPYITSVVSRVGEIEFIDGGPGAPPVGQRVTTGPEASPEQNVYQTLFTGQEILAAALPDPGAGQIFYRLTLQPATIDRLSNFAESHSNRYICMVMDGEVLNCSLMYHWTDNTIEILPGLSSGTTFSLSDLSVFLTSGPLPVPLSVESP
jgi:preprotein translocase subunit SecD